MQRDHSARAYCGATNVRLEREHVVPKSLFRSVAQQSKVRRITVPACAHCNRGWSAIEPHFRNILLISGEPNQHVHELWRGPTERSCRQPDGRKRLRDIVEQMVPVTTPEGSRHMVSPERDPRFMQVIRKIVCGLSYYHVLLAPVLDEQVGAEVLKVDVPGPVLDVMRYEPHEPEIFDYWYLETPTPEIQLFWILRFFEHRIFVGRVDRQVRAADTS